jgi:hypothetical protein
MRQSAGAFSPPENTDSKSSRLSMIGLAVVSVRVVMLRRRVALRR